MIGGGWQRDMLAELEKPHWGWSEDPGSKTGEMKTPGRVLGWRSYPERGMRAVPSSETACARYTRWFRFDCAEHGSKGKHMGGGSASLRAHPPKVVKAMAAIEKKAANIKSPCQPSDAA